MDIADILKPLIVDRAIFSLVNLETLDETEHFEPAPKRGIYLNDEGREIFVKKLRKTMRATARLVKNV